MLLVGLDVLSKLDSTMGVKIEGLAQDDLAGAHCSRDPSREHKHVSPEDRVVDHLDDQERRVVLEREHIHQRPPRGTK